MSSSYPTIQGRPYGLLTPRNICIRYTLLIQIQPPLSFIQDVLRCACAYMKLRGGWICMSKVYLIHMFLGVFRPLRGGWNVREGRCRRSSLSVRGGEAKKEKGMVPFLIRRWDWGGKSLPCKWTAEFTEASLEVAVGLMLTCIHNC